MKRNLCPTPDLPAPFPDAAPKTAPHGDFQKYSLHIKT